MKVTVILLAVAACLVGPTASAGAQTFSDLHIKLVASAIQPIGGELPRGGVGTGPIVIGKKTTAGFSQMAELCGGFGSSGSQDIFNGATSAWSAEITPVRVEDHAVTFHLHWIRARDGNKPSISPMGDVDLTMHPGESMPIDVIPFSPAMKLIDGRPCGVTATSLRVAVEYWPTEEMDRQLAGVDLWLVERLPNGTERSQPLSVRGLFNRPIPAYFESVIDQGASLDFFGQVTATPKAGAIEVKLDMRGRLTQGGKTSTVWRSGFGTGMSRPEPVPVLTLKPDDVVSVELPKLSEPFWGVFMGRSFSIRVKARQIR